MNTTKTAQFTPGLWSAYNAKNGFTYKHWRVNTGTGLILLDDAAHWEAGNAALIAAAPAMYEALAKLRLEAIHYRNTGVGKQFLNEAITQAEQAINQVWGEGNHDTK